MDFLFFPADKVVSDIFTNFVPRILLDFRFDNKMTIPGASKYLGTP
jgi:hypothetical protein